MQWDAAEADEAQLRRDAEAAHFKRGFDCFHGQSPDMVEKQRGWFAEPHPHT
eukprot:COSAG04_NODE_1061_length_8505_cov_15.541042_3_plen_52_part_00